MFRRKLLKRPLARRCPTEYIQPHGLHPCSLPTERDQATACSGRSNMGRIGWTAMRGDELLIPAPKPLQKLPDWRVGKSGGLVLSSSARVTQMTYQTAIGVRYPELVTVNPTGCTFGRFVPPDEDLPGGFLPVFWDVPRANVHAVVDIGAVVDWLQFQINLPSSCQIKLGGPAQSK